MDNQQRRTDGLVAWKRHYKAKKIQPQTSSSSPSGTERIKKLLGKKGSSKRKKIKFPLEKDKGTGPYVMGISTAEAFDLRTITKDKVLARDYQISHLDEEADEAVHCKFLAERSAQDNNLHEFYIFSDGAVIFWNMPQPDRTIVLSRLRIYQQEAYPMDVVKNEVEEMTYKFIPHGSSKIKNNTLHLNIAQYQSNANHTEAILERFAFSHAIAMSVKLGICESILNFLAEESELPLKMAAKVLKRGDVIMDSKQVLKISGELASLRHEVNLSWDILSQDAYWDRSDLESIYSLTMNYFGIERRLKILNDRIDYCEKLLSLSVSHIQHVHSSRLEWFIIWLIMIEVVFEVVHFAEKFGWVTFPV